MNRTLLALYGVKWDPFSADVPAGALFRTRHAELFCTEAEEVFFNQPLIIHPDAGHSSSETRFLALGVTDSGRHLFLAFTLRDTLIRIISARDMTRRELRAYGQTKA